MRDGGQTNKITIMPIYKHQHGTKPNSFQPYKTMHLFAFGTFLFFVGSG